MLDRVVGMEIEDTGEIFVTAWFTHVDLL